MLPEEDQTTATVKTSTEVELVKFGRIVSEPTDRETDRQTDKQTNKQADILLKIKSEKTIFEYGKLIPWAYSNIWSTFSKPNIYLCHKLAGVMY